jgi:hypothetical protein
MFPVVEIVQTQAADAISETSVRRLRRLLVTIVSLVLWGFGTHGTFAGTGDEPHYLAIAHSLAFDGDLDLRNNYGAFEPLVAGGNLVPEAHVRDIGGTLRPVHDVGLPLLFAPVVRVVAPLVALVARAAPEALMRSAKLTPTTLYRHALSLAMIALAAILAALMFDALVALDARAIHRGRAAFATTLLLMASPPLVAYSTLFFTELLSALLSFVAFTRLVWRPAHGVRAWLALGAVIGFLLLVHVRNVGLVVGLTIVASIVLARQGTARERWAFFAGLAAMLALRTAITHHMWGTWVTTPHATPGPWEGWVATARLTGMRLIALLVDQEYGLLIYAPVYALALAGVVLLAQRAPQVARSLVFVTGCYVAFVVFPLTNMHGWSGQWCPAGRFLTPVTPFLGIAVFFALRAWPRSTAFLIAAQIALSAYWWQHPKLLWNDGDGRAAFCAHLGERACTALPSLAPTVR